MKLTNYFKNCCRSRTKPAETKTETDTASNPDIESNTNKGGSVPDSLCSSNEIPTQTVEQDGFQITIEDGTHPEMMDFEESTGTMVIHDISEHHDESKMENTHSQSTSTDYETSISSTQTSDSTASASCNSSSLSSSSCSDRSSIDPQEPYQNGDELKSDDIDPALPVIASTITKYPKSNNSCSTGHSPRSYRKFRAAPQGITALYPETEFSQSDYAIIRLPTPSEDGSNTANGYSSPPTPPPPHHQPPQQQHSQTPPPYSHPPHPTGTTKFAHSAPADISFIVMSDDNIMNGTKKRVDSRGSCAEGLFIKAVKEFESGGSLQRLSRSNDDWYTHSVAIVSRIIIVALESIPIDSIYLLNEIQIEEVVDEVRDQLLFLRDGDIQREHVLNGWATALFEWPHKLAPVVNAVDMMIAEIAGAETEEIERAEIEEADIKKEDENEHTDSDSVSNTRCPALDVMLAPQHDRVCLLFAVFILAVAMWYSTWPVADALCLDMDPSLTYDSWEVSKIDTVIHVDSSSNAPSPVQYHVVGDETGWVTKGTKGHKSGSKSGTKNRKRGRNGKSTASTLLSPHSKKSDAENKPKDSEHTKENQKGEKREKVVNVQKRPTISKSKSVSNTVIRGANESNHLHSIKSPQRTQRPQRRTNVHVDRLVSVPMLLPKYDSTAFDQFGKEWNQRIMFNLSSFGMLILIQRHLYFEVVICCGVLSEM